MTPTRRRLSSPLALVSSALLAGCYVNVVPLASGDAGATDAPFTDGNTYDAPSPDAAPVDAPVVDGGPAPTGAASVDLLVVIDNSNSMTHGQEYLTNYLGNVLPPLFARYGVRDVHLGVVSTDLGTPGTATPSCANTDGGDHGVLNPRLRGVATRTRPLVDVSLDAFCTPDVTDAPFMTVRDTDDAMFVVNAPRCQTQIGLGGCGLEQQLEAAYRALLTHSAAGGRNAGFLRADATLAVLVLTDEDDGSVRDCRYHDGVGACADAADVYEPAATRWASADLNLRFYRGAAGGPQDPTWPLERYVDPARPTRGLLGLKPGHPERIVFGAITGVPLAVPQRADGRTDWDALLGPAPAGRPDDFYARDGARAYANPRDPSGPTSMRAIEPDPMCSTRTVPACRLRGSAPTLSCAASDQPFAWRARRIAEIARRFDESALCAGAPCRNGMVASICDTGDAAPFSVFADMIGRRVTR
jgi:hypothetical protein